MNQTSDTTICVFGVKPNAKEQKISETFNVNSLLFIFLNSQPLGRFENTIDLFIYFVSHPRPFSIQTTFL